MRERGYKKRNFTSEQAGTETAFFKVRGLTKIGGTTTVAAYCS